jgi:hypothetical protein
MLTLPLLHRLGVWHDRRASAQRRTFAVKPNYAEHRRQWQTCRWIFVSSTKQKLMTVTNNFGTTAVNLYL